MKTPIQQLIDKYKHHLENDSDLDSISGKDILKVVLVDLISYKIKEEELLLDSFHAGVDCEFGGAPSFDQWYKKTFKK
jgi:hypothetical protein